MNINGYKIERELGRGGMATVYLAIQLALERQVALKVMNPALAADEDFKNRFLKEGPIAAKLNDPQIVTIYDTGTDSDHYFLAMEYLPGGTLKQKIKQDLPLERALAIAKMLGSALGYAHSRNVLHRDFKPHNVLFRDNGTPVLTDFGIAKAVGGNSQMTIPGASIGSPMYMSPEQAGGKDLDYRSDIYSLGVVFYEMLTGKPPYQSKDNFALALMHINEPIPQLPEDLAAFQPVLDKLLAKAPDDRFKIAEQFVEALKQAEQEYYSEKKIAAARPSADDGSKRQQPIIRQDKPERSSLQAGSSEQYGDVAQRGRKGYLWWGAGVAAVILITLSWIFATRGTDIGALIAEAQALREKGSLEKSLSVVEKGLSTQPEHPVLLDLRQKIEQEQQNFAEAKSFFEKAVELKESGQLEQSLDAINSGLQLSPDYAELLQLQQEVQTLFAQQKLEQDIKNLLAKAQQQFHEQRLLEPAGDNAFESYMQILELNKENDVALQGLQRIAAQYLAWAQASKATEPLSTTRKYIEKGLTVWPGHEGLLALRDDVVREEQKLDGVQKAIADARQLLQQKDFQGSLAIIKSGLEILPNHQELLDLEQEVLADEAEAQRLAKADEALNKALDLQKQGQFEDALSTVASGLDYAPEHSGLLDLRNRINKSIDERQRSQESDKYLAEALALQQKDDLPAALEKTGQGLALLPEHQGLLRLQNELRAELNQRQGIAQLLVKGREQLERRQLTVPEGDNALETYRQVLATDPTNPEAQAGLDLVAAEYLRLAERNKASGQLAKSLDFIAKGLAVRPTHTDLLALQEAIQNQNQAAQLILQGQSLAEQGELEQSLQAIEKGLELTPLNADLLALQARVQADLYLLEAQQLLRQKRAFNASLEKIRAGLELVPQHRQLLELQGEIQHLLQAERHLAQARESVQKGDLDAGLREVSEGLKLVPQHAELHKLQDTIEQQIDIRERQRQAEQHLATAKDLEQEGKLNESLQEIEKGLAIAGEHPELLVLQNHVLAEQIRYQDADKLLQQAQRLNDDGRFEQAMQVVLEGLALAPKHQALSELQQKLNVELAQQIDLDERQQRANQLFVRAQEQNREGDPGASLVTAQQGLKMLPQHTELQALSDQLLEQLMILTEPELELAKSDVQAQSIQQVDQLLILAKQQFERRQLTRPADNNAFDNYQKVLQLDPDNNAAKAGLQSIAKLYLQWAQSNIRKGNLTKGLNNIDKGLGVLPQQKELQALRSEVIAKMSQHEQEQTVQPVPRQRITVDPCGINKGSKACWCKTFGMFCN